MYQFKEEERIAYESNPIAMAIYEFADGEVRTHVVSDGFCRIMHAERETLRDILDRDMFGLVHPEDRPRLMKLGEEYVLGSSVYDIIYRIRPIDSQEYFYVHTKAYKKVLDDGSIIGFFYYMDINTTVRGISLMSQDEFYSVQTDFFYKDEITGLPNSNYFHEFYDEKVQYFFEINKQPYLIYTDLNGMQAYNNQYGNVEGDKLLRLTGQIMREELPGAVICRDCEDHILAIVPMSLTGNVDRGDTMESTGEACSASQIPENVPTNAGESAATKNGFERESAATKNGFEGESAATKNGFEGESVAVDDGSAETQDNLRALGSMINRIQERLVSESTGNTMGILAGVVELTPAITGAEAIDHAKHAIRAIGTDLNQVYCVYSQEVENAYLHERYIIENIDHAMKSGWIRVYYQGILRTQTRKFASFEALARWDDPELGLMQPKDFIPALQKYHMISSLDLFMLEQVCREWQTRIDYFGVEMPTSVNFSAQGFDQFDMVARIQEIVDSYHISHDKIIIEITEQDVAKADQRFQKQLMNLKELGFKIWVDDFGSGYSSLNVFNRYNFDLIKLDLELLRNLDCNNGTNRKILTAMVRLAKSLGVHTLAEGLDNEEQLQFLREAGCGRAQGYLFSRPKSIEAHMEHMRMNQSLSPESPEEAEELDALEVAHDPSRLEYRPDSFRDLPVAYAVFEAHLNEDETAIQDAIYRFVNPQYSRMFGKPIEELIGRPVGTALGGIADLWWKRGYEVMTQGKVIKDRVYSKIINHWIDFVIAPANEPGMISVIFLNVDEDHAITQQLERDKDTGLAILDIAQVLGGSLQYERVIKQSLAMIGEKVNLRSISIFEFQGQSDARLTFHWSDPDSKCDETHLQELFGLNRESPVITEFMEGQTGLHLESVESIKEYSASNYDALVRNGVLNVLSVPLINRGEIIGYMIAENLQEEQDLDAERLIEAVSYFLAQKIVSAELMTQLEEMSILDQLTNVQNRNALMQRAEELQENYAKRKQAKALQGAMSMLNQATKNAGLDSFATGIRLNTNQYSLGIIYVDANGLKQINDASGHEAGDGYLRKIARLLSDICGEKFVYRAGGDEFVVMMEGISKEDFDEVMQELHQRIDEDSEVSIAIGTEWLESAENVEEAIHEADHRMYEDKKKYYMTHDRRRRQ